MRKQLSTVGIVFLLFFFSFFAVLSQHAVASGWINVTSPSDGQVYYEGDTSYITWTSYGAGGYVKIELYYGDSYDTITSNTSNSGSYLWTIHTYTPSYYAYQIKITSLKDGSISDYNYGYFYIYQRTITVNSPSIGEIWYGGDTYIISWNSENAGDYVKIYYSYGSTDHLINSYAYNSGSYYWSIPYDLSTGSTYKIKIESISFSGVYDYSDYFSIYRRYIKITSPTQGDTWYKGETYTITWNSENAGDYVTLELYYNGYYYSAINSNTENDGSYTWLIPSGLDSTDYYQIKITSTSYSNIYDYNGYFSINERKITVNSPYAGETWYKGETYTITWTSVNAGNYVSIELYKDGSYYSTIISNTSNDGSYSWQIPTDPTSSSSCKIKIKSLVYSNLYGISEYFSIDNRSITITFPSEGNTWYKGDRYTITWDSKGSGDYVNIELYKDGLYYSSIATNVANNGNYPWRIPSGISPGSYQIKITSTAYSSVSAYSSGYVKIDDTLLQKSLGPVIIIIVLAIILSVVFIMLNKRRKIAKPEEDKEEGVSDSPTPVNIKREIKAEKISDDEYEQIWEKNKHK